MVLPSRPPITALSFLCCCSLLFFLTLLTSAHDFLTIHDSGIDLHTPGAFRAPARRSLLSDAKRGRETALVAALNGTIYLLEVGSMKPIWSFSSGTPIYSSYQAPPPPATATEHGSELEPSYFIDCDDDWELYAQTSLGKVKLTKNLEEYMSSTPQIGDDGGIVLGSKETVVFSVDARTGRVIHSYRMADSTSKIQYGDKPNNTTPNMRGAVSELKADELPLHVTRTDYTWTSFMPNSNKVLWNFTVAEIGVALLCPDDDKSFGGTLINSESSDQNLQYKMPLSCHSRALVYRLRNNTIFETLSKPLELPSFHQDETLPASSTEALPSQPHIEKVLEHLPSSRGGGEAADTKNRKELGVRVSQYAFKEKHDTKVRSSFFKYSTSKLVLCLMVLVLAVYGYTLYRKKKLVVQSNTNSTNIVVQSNSNSTNIHSRRRRSRKIGKTISNDVRLDKETNEAKLNREKGVNFWQDLNQPISDGSKAYTIGKLVVTNKEIAKGSNGTIVIEGVYDGRPVAVKRLVRAYNDIAFKEVRNLIMSDHHPNIVRWYGVEQDQNFVYLALERCACNLNDLILMHLKSLPNPNFGISWDVEMATEHTISLDDSERLMQGYELWNSDGYPSNLLLKLMRDVIFGISHLHELGIVHRDLKPQNVLITYERSLCAKLSDMGISKRLVGDMSSLGINTTGCGSSGWQAPEQLLHGRQTRAVDLFSLGCVLYFSITGGRHPFGNHLERDVNITKNLIDLFYVEHIPEAVDLFLRLLNPIAEMRPRALDVLCHPLFWNAEMRLAFLRDTSDRIELEDREINSSLLRSLESIGYTSFGSKWNEKLDPSFLNNIGRYRRYRFDSVRDLLRVLRNKLNHYREIPAEIQEVIGTVPEGFDRYFRSRFPKLLIEVYKVVLDNCTNEECFAKYFTVSPQ